MATAQHYVQEKWQALDSVILKNGNHIFLISVTERFSYTNLV